MDGVGEARDWFWARSDSEVPERSLVDAWEANATDWIAWARTPMHDVYEFARGDAEPGSYVG